MSWKPSGQKKSRTAELIAEVIKIKIATVFSNEDVIGELD